MTNAQSIIAEAIDSTEVWYAAFGKMSIQSNATKTYLDETADGVIAKALKSVSRRVLGVKVMQVMRELMDGLYNHFGEDAAPDIRQVAKFWGADFEDNHAQWTASVAVLLKLDSANSKYASLYSVESTDVRYKNPYHICVVCAKTGWFKKCACGKDRYCGAECQKADWKRHKVAHH